MPFDGCAVAPGGGAPTTPAAIGPVHVSTSIADGDLVAFLAAHPQSTPFHSAAWGRAVEGATGHRWHILVARGGDGAILGVLPLHHIRSRLFGSTLASAGFAVDGGLLVTHPSAIDPLAEAAIALARELGVPGVDLRGGIAPAGWTVDDGTYLGFSRPIAGDVDAELASIPRKHRAEVRKALANRDSGLLTIATGRSAADQAAHFAAYSTSVRNLGTPVFPRRLFTHMIDHFGEAADILTISSAGQGVASVLSLYWNGAVMPYWGGGTQAARGLRGNELMYFGLMDHARGRGMRLFDFGRSKTGTGPAAYKKNWGFDARPLAYARWSADGAPVRDTNPTSAKYRLMVDGWQRLPLWLANFAGPFIARQLG